LEGLSCFVNIVVTRRADGGVNVSIGGVAMVSGAKTPDNLATFPDKNENLRIQAQNTGKRLKLTGGSIAGKITARDGGLADLQSGLDKLASQMIARFNSIYSSGCDSNGRTGRDFFTGTDASDIAVNSIFFNDPLLLQADGAAGANGNNTAAPALETSGYAQTVSNLGSTLSKVGEDLGNSHAVTQMLANERESGHGVLIGEESTDLRRYEQACTASTKMHSKLNKMPPMQ
jgi:flagellar hook-associated protein 1 FlgK